MADKTLIINNDLRTITIPEHIKNLGVEFDKDVMRLHFSMPKTYGDIDLTAFSIRINYLNANSDGDVYPVADKTVKEDKITFSWLVGRKATAYKGKVKFIVCMKEVDAAGRLLHEFNTTPASLPVLEGLETAEAVVQDNPDILENILLRLSNLEADGGGGGTVKSVNGVAPDDNGNVEVEAVEYRKASGVDHLVINDSDIPEQELQIKLTGGSKPDYDGVWVNRYGRNLIAFPYVDGGAGTVKTVNGITWTFNEDGSITASGTATGGNSVITLVKDLPISGYTFTLSGCPTGGNVGSGRNYSIYTWDGKSSWFDEGNGVTKPAAGSVNVAMSIVNGKTVENVVFKPQLEIGMRVSAFEPYKGVQRVFADADGTVRGVTSLSPTMTIIQSRVGAIIGCKYSVPYEAHIQKQIAAAAKSWAHLKWACMGDSHTEHNARALKNYHDYVSEKTGIQVVNLGASGTGYKAQETNNKAFYQRIVDVPEDTDVVTIYGSGNDLSQTLGTPTDTGTDTICGCVNTAIDNIYARLPLVQLGIISPCPWGAYPPSNADNLMAKYSEALRQICANRSIPFLDLYHESGLRPWEESFLTVAYTRDNGNSCHPDENGHKILSSRFYAFLSTMIGSYTNEEV